MLAPATAYYLNLNESDRLSAEPSEIERSVRALFSVKETFVLPDGGLEFQVAYDEETSRKFIEIKGKAPGYVVELSGSEEECVLTLKKEEPRVPRKASRLPVLMAFFTAAAVVFSALLQQQVYRELMPSWPDYLPFIGFGLTVAAFLGAHELGQRVVARARGAGHASSYLIPGIPFIPPFLPSLGFASSQTEAAVNRDSLFDAVVAGPLAMLVLAVALFALGQLTAVQSAVTFASTNLGSTTVTVNPGAIQLALGTLLSPFAHSIAPGYVAVSPIADGAFIGFILVFFALLPMAAYDGGLLASLALGQRAARVATYLSILALLILDTWTYWAVAIIVLLIAGRPVQTRLQDSVSPLSSSRRWLMVGVVVVAFLCVPIPGNIATLPLP